MKVTVNRQLSAGKFRINFEVGDFTLAELSKMSSFGVPMIDLKWMSASGLTTGRIALNQIHKGFEATFTSGELAKEYEDQVLDQIRTSMQRLRESKDDFSSSQEVDL